MHSNRLNTEFLMPAAPKEIATPTPLVARVLEGDIEGVMDVIDAMSPTERTASRPSLDRIAFNRWNLCREWDKGRANRLFRAIDLARFMCSADQPTTDYWMHVGVQDIAAFKQRYQPAISSQPIEKQLRGEHGWHYQHHVHRAVIAGLVERPQSEEYLDALFFGDLRGEFNIILKYLEADPALPPYLLQLFEREGTSDGSFAAREKYCHDPELHWSHAFITLSHRGDFSRTQLLDKTLGALSCDWPQFKSGWFSRFHEILAPTVAEMAPFVERYLALCYSRIAPTVSLAMDAIAQLYKANQVDEQQLCEALQPVIGSAVKGRVQAALDILGQMVKKSPHRAGQASAIALHALAHSAADVQKKTIACLQAWGLNAESQAAVLGYRTYVAAVNQVALSKLLEAGAQNSRVNPETLFATAIAIPAQEPLQLPAVSEPISKEVQASSTQISTLSKISPLDPSRVLLPLTTLVDLIERIAYVFENPLDVDELERAAEALVRFAPVAQADRAAFSALKKRARNLKWDSKPLGFALARLMACAVDGEDTADGVMRLQPDEAINTANFVAWRTYSLIAQAKKGLGLPPFSAPTHRGGFIDPTQLAARTAAYKKAGARISASEQAFAQMRLVSLNAASDLGARPESEVERLTVSWHVTSSEPNEGGYLFHTLHVDGKPKLKPTHDHDYSMLLRAKHLTGRRWGGEHDASDIRFAASLQPGSLEPFFAEAARAIGNNLDWWEAQWQNRAYLDVLLEPTTAITSMAYLTLGLALAGKEPGQAALAVDGLVRTARDGRLDITAMGETLARLWATPLVKGQRYGKCLAAAAQANEAMPLVVFALICSMAAVKPEAPRKDFAPLLELLVELKLAYGFSLAPSTRAALSAMRLSGKSKLAAQTILA